MKMEGQCRMKEYRKEIMKELEDIKSEKMLDFLFLVFCGCENKVENWRKLEILHIWRKDMRK